MPRILIRLLIKNQPLQQWPVGREFRRRLKKAFDEQGIKIGIPQQIEFKITDPYPINGNDRGFGGQTGMASRNRN